MNSLGLPCLLVLAQDCIQKGYNEDILIHSLCTLFAVFISDLHVFPKYYTCFIPLQLSLREETCFVPASFHLS